MSDATSASSPSAWSVAADLLDPPPDQDRDTAQRALGSLREFVPVAWPGVERREFKSNWHIDVICEHLQAVSEGQVLRLAINVPPRHMKSLAAAVFWPCWDWLSRPERQWMFASYAQQLSKRDSVKCRRLLESQGGRREDGTIIERLGYAGLLELCGRRSFALGADRVFDPDTETWRLTGDQNEKLRFENDQGGYRIATSIGGTATGEGGDILVLDDPHKADEVESDVQRENVIDWIDGTLPTRLNDPNTGAIVVVMQRLHEQDATGHLLEQGGYTHLCLPAEYEPSHPFVWPDDPRSEPGELLWPDHFGTEALADLKLRLSSYRAAGQLQQRPSPAEGGILKRAWWRYYPRHLVEAEPPWQGPRFQRIWQSWDTAMKDKTTNDYTVGTLWGQDLANIYLLRVERGRWGMVDTCERVRNLTAWAKSRFPDLGCTVRIENTANGPEIMAALRGEIPGLVPIKADRDKVSRAHAITFRLEGGNVFVPGKPAGDLSGCDPVATPAWVQQLIDECAGFPNGAFDDQVDSVTQALDPRYDTRASTPKAGGRPITGRLSLANQ